MTVPVFSAQVYVEELRQHNRRFQSKRYLEQQDAPVLPGHPARFTSGSDIAGFSPKIYIDEIQYHVSRP